MTLSLHSSAKKLSLTISKLIMMWFHRSNATDLAAIHTFNFSVARSVSQIVDFPTCLSDQYASFLDFHFTSFS